jgi:signal recognition particle subunit SRP54
MFDDLSRKLDAALKRLRGQGKISEENVAETLRDVRRVLLDADVNYKVARDFVDSAMKRATGREVLESITPGQQIVKILFDELVALLGTSSAEIATAPMHGTIKRLGSDKGFGFILQDVTFERGHGPKGPRAEQVKVA